MAVPTGYGSDLRTSDSERGIPKAALERVAAVVAPVARGRAGYGADPGDRDARCLLDHDLRMEAVRAALQGVEDHGRDRRDGPGVRSGAGPRLRRAGRP